MKSVRFPGLVALLTAVTCVVATPAFAQSNNETFPQFQWNFSTPGARANAMGRAFIALADDASAAISNPAGLVRLSKKQAYFEFKSTTIKTDRLSNVDSLFTLIPTTFETKTNAPSFFSFSMPVGDRLAFSFAVHQFLNFKEDFDLKARPIPGTFSVFRPLDGTSDFVGMAYAASVAFAASKHLQLGASVTFNTLKAQQQTDRFTVAFGDPANQFDVTRSNVLINQTKIDDSASSAGVIVGLLYEANDKLSIGLSYTKAPSFTVAEDLRSNQSGTPGGALSAATGFPKDVHINVPNRGGFGVAYRPVPRLLAALDVVRIGYSRLANDFTIVFPADDIKASDYSIPSVTEVHFGGEYLVVTGDTRLFVRGGVFTNPDHATHYSGPDLTEIARVNLPPFDEAVGTVGFGLAFKDRFQVDLAIVAKHEVVFSFGARF